MSKTRTKPFAIILVKANNDYFIQLNDDKSVAGFDSTQEALVGLEATYNRNHARGREGSASACINYIYFQRAVVMLKSVADLKKKLLKGEPRLHELQHVSGWMLGIMADQEKAKSIWDAAPKPRLISGAMIS